MFLGKLQTSGPTEVAREQNRISHAKEYRMFFFFFFKFFHILKSHPVLGFHITHSLKKILTNMLFAINLRRCINESELSHWLRAYFNTLNNWLGSCSLRI